MIHELLAIEDNKTFVYKAMHTLLKREPDDEGIAHYLRRIHNGIPRLVILSEIRYSSEGQKNKEEVKCVNLDKLVDKYRTLRNLPIGGMKWILLGRSFRDISFDEVDSSKQLKRNDQDDVQKNGSESKKENVINNDLLANILLKRKPDKYLTISEYLSKKYISLENIDKSAWLHNLEQYSNDLFLRLSYIWLLGRAIDIAGLRDYTDSLESGITREEIFTSIINSDEYIKYKVSPDPFSLLGSPLHPNASIYITPNFKSDVYEILFKYYSDEVFMRVIFLWLLGRGIDSDSMFNYMSLLENKVSRSTIVTDIYNSPECFKYRRDGNPIPLAGTRNNPFSEINISQVKLFYGTIY